MNFDRQMRLKHPQILPVFMPKMARFSQKTAIFCQFAQAAPA
jgi:hypothetical protein